MFAKIGLANDLHKAMASQGVGMIFWKLSLAAFCRAYFGISAY
jgi:hypothetical protein